MTAEINVGSDFFYIEVGDNGRIVSSGRSNQEAIDYSVAHNLIKGRIVITPENVSPNSNYVGENDTIIAMPARPSKEHMFDYVTKEWSIETAYRSLRFSTIESAREWGRAVIDTQAGKARARYITVTHGQDATYQAKYADARAYRIAGYPADASAYPWVVGEATATNQTPQQAADGICAVGDPWNLVLGPAIESLRIGGKESLLACMTIPDIITEVLTIRGSLENI